MFTGIITDIGTVIAREERGDTRFTIATSYDPATIDMGASIACNGVCLTVVDKGTNGKQQWFAVEASAETLSCTTLGDWQEGKEINLERALRVGDELGGHFVTGHVDGVGKIMAMQKVGDSTDVSIEISEKLMPFVAPKGSICVNGISLTVNKTGETGQNSLNCNIISHTFCVTTIKSLQKGDNVNIEVDILARYIHRHA